MAAVCFHFNHSLTQFDILGTELEGHGNNPEQNFATKPNMFVWLSQSSFYHNQMIFPVRYFAGGVTGHYVQKGSKTLTFREDYCSNYFV